LRGWIKLTFIQIMLWLKTRLHPESLGLGSRRNKPRRRSDRRRENFQKFWLACLTALWIWMAVSLQHNQREIARVAQDNINQRCELTGILVKLAEQGGDRFAQPLISNYVDCIALLKESGKVP
jgi:hypothetical protein